MSLCPVGGVVRDVLSNTLLIGRHMLYILAVTLR